MTLVQDAVFLENTASNYTATPTPNSNPNKHALTHRSIVNRKFNSCYALFKWMAESRNKKVIPTLLIKDNKGKTLQGLEKCLEELARIKERAYQIMENPDAF